jgi:hypothetical protein
MLNRLAALFVTRCGYCYSTHGHHVQCPHF